MALRLCDDMEEALEIYLDSTLAYQHQYNVYDIDAVAEELTEMGFTIPLP